MSGGICPENPSIPAQGCAIAAMVGQFRQCRAAAALSAALIGA